MVDLPKILYQPERTLAGMGEDDFCRNEVVAVGTRRVMMRDAFLAKIIVVLLLVMRSLGLPSWKSVPLWFYYGAERLLVERFWSTKFRT